MPSNLVEIRNLVAFISPIGQCSMAQLSKLPIILHFSNRAAFGYPFYPGNMHLYLGHKSGVKNSADRQLIKQSHGFPD